MLKRFNNGLLNNRESVIKTNLTDSLVDCIKELQLRHASDGQSGPLKNDESTNTLCWILEGILIHGLKSPFLKSLLSNQSQSSSSISSNSSKSGLPQPSYWEFVLVFSPSDLILRVNGLTNIHTDIGRSRAWLRIILNEGVFSLISYFQLMLNDMKTIRYYYNASAFLRDPERCDIMKNYLFGIESYTFSLAANSSLLNSWNSGPLRFIGLDVKDTTVSTGIDVAENMEAQVLQAVPTLCHQSHSGPSTPYGTPFRTPLLEEDEALRVILSSRPLLTYQPPPVPVPVQSKNHQSNPTTPQLKQTKNTIRSKDPKVGPTNILIENQEKTLINTNSMNEENLTSKRTPSEMEPYPISPALSMTNTNESDECSYADLFHSYNRSETVIGTPITIDSFLDTNLPSFFNTKKSQTTNTLTSGEDFGSSTTTGTTTNTSNAATPLGSIDFDNLPNHDEIGEEEEDNFRRMLKRIPNETGLDLQNYKCPKCDRPIGMFYGQARVCGFFGSYYCTECHINDESVIPSRILLNWDFNKYTISKEAKGFLNEILDEPLFDLFELNPKLYREIDEVGRLKKQRTKLTSISIYLQKCPSTIMNEFVKDIWQRDYLYTSVHRYSLSDLLSIPNRTLIHLLDKLVGIGRHHIKSCGNCQQFGFICEICRDPKLLFPFDLERIYKCNKCGAVFHKKCLDTNQRPCPRCQRFKIQEDKKNESEIL